MSFRIQVELVCDGYGAASGCTEHRKGRPLPRFQMNTPQTIAGMTTLAAFEKGYRVNEYGQLISPSGLVRKTQVHKKFESANIKCPDGKSRRIQIHRLAAFQKFDAIIFDKTYRIAHSNGDRLDNRPSNIELSTLSEISMSRPGSERAKSASNPRYSAQTIRELRKDHAIHGSYRKLEEKFGMSKSTIARFLKMDLTKKAPLQRPSKKTPREKRIRREVKTTAKHWRNRIRKKGPRSPYLIQFGPKDGAMAGTEFNLSEYDKDRAASKCAAIWRAFESEGKSAAMKLLAS